MAAVSQTMTTLTPPSSSHGWDIPMSERPLRDSKSHNDNYYSSSRPSQPAQYGTTAVFGANAGVDPVPRKYSNGESASDMKSRSTEPNSFQPHQHKDPRPRGVKENGSPADSPADLYEGGARNERAKGPPRKTAEEMYGGDSVYDDENSKWIHRDKLALIESAELQAAGIFLPKPRDRDRDSVRSKSQNRAKRDPGLDQGSEPPRAVSGPEQTSARSRKNSAATTGDPKTPDAASNPGWDLRLPEEIEEEGDGYWVSVGGRASRIPVAKVSPVPIPNEQLERDKLLVRKRDSSPGEEDAITYPKTRARSGSTGNALAKTPTNGTLSQPAPQPSKPVSPKKGTPAAGARKPSGAKPNGAVGRPKTRGGPSKDSTSSGGGTRPSTRSGERELSIGSSKQMEGDPPWMVSAYRPDPRLPPDQQLLPTVAKRLQQEKWIREGKFGNVYDKEFRPLSDEGFPKRPDQDTAPEQDEEQNHDEKAEREDRDERDERDNLAGDWPLRAESKPARSSSYSTMPRISDKQTMSPLPSPRPPSQQHLPASVIRVQDPPEDPPQKKSGCGCCIVM